MTAGGTDRITHDLGNSFMLALSKPTSRISHTAVVNKDFILAIALAYWIRHTNGALSPGGKVHLANAQLQSLFYDIGRLELKDRRNTPWSILNAIYKLRRCPDLPPECKKNHTDFVITLNHVTFAL